MGSRQLLLSATFICTTGLLLTSVSCKLHHFIDVIPPQSMTDTTLSVTKHRIGKFWNEHGKVPTHPDELPDEKDRNCEMKDGWGRELHWESDGTSRVRLWSLGRDGKPQGALATIKTRKSSLWWGVTN